MKKQHLFRQLMRLSACASLAVVIGAATASSSYFGKLDILQVTRAPGFAPVSRYVVTGQGLSLFATETFDAVMREALFTKAPLNVAFDVINCPLGISGTCGNVTFLSVTGASVP